MNKPIAEYIIPCIKEGRDVKPDFVNAEKLIRCEDCKHWIGMNWRCLKWKHFTRPNGYCFKGETK